jgi:hypothetical protein
MSLEKEYTEQVESEYIKDGRNSKKNYQIAISQNGSYAVTFDTGKFHYR